MTTPKRPARRRMTLQMATREARRAEAEAWAWAALHATLLRIVDATVRGIRYPDAPTK